MDPDEPSSSATDDGSEYIVEAIVAHKTFREACKTLLHNHKGFYCPSFLESHEHSRYVFLIKWLNWADQHKTWEEESNARGNEVLIEYKQQHGLPVDEEQDNFSAKQFLVEAVKNDDPEVTDQVRKYVMDKWILPDGQARLAYQQEKERKRRREAAEVKRRTKMEHTKTERREEPPPRRERSPSPAGRSISRHGRDAEGLHMSRSAQSPDGDSPSSRSKEMYISAKEKKREREKADRVGREEQERIRQADELEEMERKIRKHRKPLSKSKERASPAREEESDGKAVLSRQEAHRKVTERRQKENREKTMGIYKGNEDLFDSEGDSSPERVPFASTKKKEKGAERQPTAGVEVKQKPAMAGSSLKMNLMAGMLNYNAKHKPKEQKRPVVPPPLASLDDTLTFSTALNMALDVPVFKPQKPTTSRAEPRLLPQNKRPFEEELAKTEVKKPRLKEPLKSILKRPSTAESSTDGVPRSVQQAAPVYLNKVTGHRMSTRSRILTVPVRRRACSSERLNRRWEEPAENYKTLSDYLNLALTLHPRERSIKPKMSQLQVDVGFNEESGEWQFLNEEQEELRKKSGMEKVDPLLVPPPISLIRGQELDVITLEEDEGEVDTPGMPQGFMSLTKWVKTRWGNDKKRFSDNSGAICEVVTAYSRLQPDAFLKAFRGIRSSAVFRLQFVNELVKKIHLEGSSYSNLQYANMIPETIQRFFEADGAQKKPWYSVPGVCHQNHAKCRMMDTLLTILGVEARFHPYSPFSPHAFYHCMKFGAPCQKKKLFYWGIPLYEKLTDYPGMQDIYVDHSLLAIRQFSAKQLMDLVELGCDINQCAFYREQTPQYTAYQPIVVKDFFRRILNEGVYTVAEKTVENINTICGEMSHILSLFVQKRIATIVDNNFPRSKYLGFLTPAHILRAVWPNRTANIYVKIDWQEQWSNYGEEDVCIPLNDSLWDDIEAGKSRILISLMRVHIETQLPGSEAHMVQQNIRIGSLNDSHCAPVSLSVNTTNVVKEAAISCDLVPVEGNFAPNEWVFLAGNDALAACHNDNRVRLSLKTTSNEVGTLFLLRFHAIQASDLNA